MPKSSGNASSAASVRPIVPTYQVSKKEGAVARGKIALAAALLDGEAGLGRAAAAGYQHVSDVRFLRR